MKPLRPLPRSNFLDPLTGALIVEPDYNHLDLVLATSKLRLSTWFAGIVLQVSS